LRVLKGLKLGVTPSKIAKTINVHPNTVRGRLIKLGNLGFTSSRNRGNRIYTKLNGK